MALVTELRVGPNRLEIKVNPEEGGAGLFAFESTFPPGGVMPYLHFHRDQEEASPPLRDFIRWSRPSERRTCPVDCG